MNEVEQRRPATPYLAIDDEGQPYLQGSKCGACNAVFVGERDNCAKCTTRGAMERIQLATTGKLYNYTIVYRSFPGVTVPFISAIVDLDGGGTLKGNLLGIEPSPEAIAFDMPVEVVFRGAEIATAAGEGFFSHFFMPQNKGEAA